MPAPRPPQGRLTPRVLVNRPKRRLEAQRNSYGTSVLPSIGALNPSLTAIANAIRVGEHLRQRLD